MGALATKFANAGRVTRRAALAGALALAGATGTTTALFAPNVASAASPCDRYKDGGEKVACIGRLLDQQTAAANARTAAANARAAKAREETAEAQSRSATFKQNKACSDYLTKKITDGDLDRGELLAQAGGKFTADNVCPIAVRNGFRQQAALSQ